MADISFDRAYGPLVTHAIGLLEKPSPADGTALGDEVGKIATSAGTDKTRAMNLGLAIIRFAGANVLEQSVETLRSEICIEEGATDELTLGSSAVLDAVQAVGALAAASDEKLQFEDRQPSTSVEATGDALPPP